MSNFFDFLKSPRFNRNDLATQLNIIADRQVFHGGISAGSASTQTLTISGITSYYDGLTISFLSNYKITGATTMNVNGLGAISIKHPISNVNLVGGTTTGQINVGDMVTMVYNGGTFYPTHPLRKYDFTPVNPSVGTGTITGGGKSGFARYDRDIADVIMRFDSWTLSSGVNTIINITLPFTPVMIHAPCSCNYYDGNWKLGGAHYDGSGNILQIKREANLQFASGTPTWFIIHGRFYLS